MASLAIPSSPNSFQLRLGFKGKQSSSIFLRLHFRTVDRRIRLFSAAGSGGRDVDKDKRIVPGHSWMNSNKSWSDSFSGWFESESGGSLRKGGFGGLLGAGVAGVILVAGITFASLSLSRRSTPGVSQQMEPLTTQQEEFLTSDDPNEKGDLIENESTMALPDEGSLQNDCNSECPTGINKDPFSSIEFTEAISDRRPDDNINMEASLIQNVESASTGDDAIHHASSQEDLQFAPDVDDSSVTTASNPRSPELPEPDLVDYSDASRNTDLQRIMASGTPDSTIELKENLGIVNLVSLSISDSDSKIYADNQEGIFVPMEFENSKLPLDFSCDSIDHFPTNTLTPDNPTTSETDMILDTQVDSRIVEVQEIATSILIEQDSNLGKIVQLPNEDIISPLESHDLNENGPSGATSTSVLADPYGIESDANVHSEIDRSGSLFDSPVPENSFSYAGIPAPSVVSVALQVPPGKVLVPAVVDQVQGQALAALQVLKVIEADVEPGDLCTRREYARWLVSASSALSRNTISKVYPAMFIENVTELAFDDVTPEDPDFASIQGLAEAGLISSKLSRRDMGHALDGEQSPILFSPQSPLSRQDLVSWKMALEKRQLPEVDKKILYQCSGFIDIDKVHPDAWPALVADLSSGEQGIIALAFGFTRLFQPDKPVTKAQAAIALATGDAIEVVGEELTRIEAESIAETAVAAHTALVAQVEKDLNANFEKELAMKKEKIDAIEKLAEEARLELERLRAEREEENSALMRGHAAVESEMELLSRLRSEAEEQLQSLMSSKMEISFERDRINKLRKEAESENKVIVQLQYELEVERKALAMARAWAEDEAKRTREQAKALVEARDRWERHGIKVVVDSDLQDDASAGVMWLNAGKESSLNAGKETITGTVNRAENLVEKLKEMASKIKGNSLVVIEKIIQKIELLISILKKQAAEASRRARELRSSLVLKVSESMDELQQSATSFGVTAKDSVKRIVGDCREGVEKITQKFKA